MNEFGSDRISEENILERIDGVDEDGEFTGDLSALSDDLAENSATFEEHVEVDVFLIEYAKKLETASRVFSERVAALQALTQRWGVWREAARAAGKTDLDLGAWRSEVMGTHEQHTAFVR